MNTGAIKMLRIEVDGHFHGSSDVPRPWVARIDGASRDELQAYLLLAFHCSPERGELLGLLCGVEPHMHPSVVETREAQHGSA